MIAEEFSIELDDNPLEGNPQITFEVKPLVSAIPYERNSNFHPQAQIERLAETIKSIGFIDPIEVDEQGVILAGEGRYRAARLLGLTKAPMLIISGLSENEKTAYRIANNKHNRDSRFDNSILRVELISLQMAEIDIPALTGITIPELKQFHVSLDVSPDIDDQLSGGREPSKPIQKAQGELGEGAIDRTHELTLIAGYQTAIQRSMTSTPMLHYAEKGYLKGDVLDYGCGVDPHSFERFDPAYFPNYELLKRRWDVITCNYVLNVIPLEHNRVELLLTIKSLLKPGGVAYIATYTKSGTDSESRAGFQSGWKPAQWESFLSEWYGSVTKLKAPFNGWRCKS